MQWAQTISIPLVTPTLGTKTRERDEMMRELRGPERAMLRTRPAVCSCHTAVPAALWLVNPADPGLWLVNEESAAQPRGECRGQLNVKSKVTPPARPGGATATGSLPGAGGKSKNAFFLCKNKICNLAQFQYGQSTKLLLYSVADKNFDLQNICYHTSEQALTDTLTLRFYCRLFCALLTTWKWV